MDKKKGIIVLLIAVVAILYFGTNIFKANTCTLTDDAEHVCVESTVHGCEGHKCEDSCNKSVNVLNNGDAKILETLKRESLFYGKTEEFEYMKNSNILTITKIVFSPVMPTNSDSKIICEEILKFIGEKKVVFNSNEESFPNEGLTERYIMGQKGKITIGTTSYSANIYFNDNSDENQTSFKGKVIFSMPSIKSLNGELLSIEIKAKK